MSFGGEERLRAGHVYTSVREAGKDFHRQGSMLFSS